MNGHKMKDTEEVRTSLNDVFLSVSFVFPGSFVRFTNTLNTLSSCVAFLFSEFQLL